MFRKYKRLIIYKIKKKNNIDFHEDNKKFKLDYLFNFYGSDKAHKFNGGNGHGFSEYYEKELEDKKNKPINILEIGSFAGASAAAFAKYFPLSKIYCLDINITKFIYKSRNIKVFGLDVSKKNEILKFFNKINISISEEFFDIIIDDGSHKLSDILFSFHFFFKNLKSSGHYIIEDYKYPNYFDHLNNCSDIKIDKLLYNLENKIPFSSSFFNTEQQDLLIKGINKIKTYKGSGKHSDIAFIKKN